MGNKYAIFAIAILAFYSSASAYSPQILSFFNTYNITPSTTNSLSSVGIVYSGKSYLEFFSGGHPYVLLNTTDASAYSFVLNTNTISSIIRNNTIQESLGGLNFAQIASEITAYMSTSASSLNDCLAETGLDRATCTLSNYCQSCGLVPACNKVLFATGGPSDTFGEGIMTFQQQYSQLAQNLSILYNATSNATSSTAIPDVGRVNFAFNNISLLTNEIYQNPIFPPPTTVNLNNCNGIGTTTLNTSLSGAPWYCNAVGFCQFLTYNYTKLSVVQNLVNTMDQNAPTPASIYAQAQSINKTESEVITPILVSEKTSQLNSILNTSLTDYQSEVNKSQALLLHINNASLSDTLSIVESRYKTMTSGYLSINLSAYAPSVSDALSNLTLLYNKEYPLYLRISSEAKNNTGFIIAIQSTGVNPETSSLAFQEDQINSEVSSQISNPSSVLSSLAKIKNESNSLATYAFGPSDIARGADGPFASALSRALGLPYAAAVASMPAFATIPSIIIGLFLFSMLYLFYRSLRKANRIKITRHSSRAWALLFALALFLVAIYAIITYAYASQANFSAPIQTFLQATSSSKSIGIVVNGTESPGIASCVSVLQSTIQSLGKKANLAYVSGNSCTFENKTESVGSCLDSLVGSSTPFISLTNSSTASMHAYSMYGTALYSSGNSGEMASCYPSFLLR